MFSPVSEAVPSFSCYRSVTSSCIAFAVSPLLVGPLDDLQFQRDCDVPCSNHPSCATWD